jgi:DNA polymerase-3 subunit alpha
MKQIEKLKAYCKEMMLDFQFEDEYLQIGDDIYKIVTDDKEILFDEELDIVVELDEDTLGWVYEFGGRWYITKHGEKVNLQELLYVGLAKQKLPTKAFLGIRSGYELMNGVGLYSDWTRKAKFLGVEALAICEKNSLSGVLSFQKECKGQKIKSIIGMTVTVEHKEIVSEIKLYVRDFQGWLNLLKYNSQINVDKENSVSVDFLLENREGLFIIADPKSMNLKDTFPGIDYYQLDTVAFTNSERDTEYAKNLASFIQSDLEPISITDAFYIDKRDSKAREALWNIAKAYDYKSNNQYFKNKDLYAQELIGLFEVGNTSWVRLFKKAISNEAELVENCNYVYDTSTRHLPRYIMTEEEAKDFKTNEDLFLFLIKKGFTQKGFNKGDSKKYLDRLKMEITVLKNGDVIDYFLTLYDIIKFARAENMMTGVGRGSAGGSLVAYLLDIIKINPLEFGLLFERFLNAGRMGAWVDCDLYSIELEDGQTVELIEGELVRIERNGKETAVLIHDLLKGDKIIRF